ncbi:MAG: hypothetical protein JO110_17625 [Acetobacteraceae bacterium]|nr:hypothetical protein [Acetobacteraceae bacterium]
MRTPIVIFAAAVGLLWLYTRVSTWDVVPNAPHVSRGAIRLFGIEIPLPDEDREGLDTIHKRLDTVHKPVDHALNTTADALVPNANNPLPQPFPIQTAIQAGLSAVLLAASLFVILSRKYDDHCQKWAVATIGTLLGFWLKGL